MLLRGWIAGFVVALSCLLHATAQDARFIRLRNTTVTTPPAPDSKARAAAVATGKPPVSGLFLIQLEGPLSAEHRETLQSKRLRLLSPVPDDSFVCHLHAASVAEIRAIPFVRWLGEYQPEWRMDRRLTAAMAAEPRTSRDIRLLLRPQTPPGLLISTLRQFSGPVHRTETAFGIFLGGKTRPGQILEMARSEAVLWIEPAGRMKLVDEVATEILMGDDGTPGKPAQVQKLGFDGRGVTVAVADSGLDTGESETMHQDLNGRVDAFFAYGGLEDASDEHSHGTHCAGIVAGSGAIGTQDDNGYLWGLGVAPGAHLVAQRLFDGAGDYYAPPSYETLTRDAVRSGAYVGSNSWGDATQGRYDLSAAEFDALVRDADARTPGEQPYILEFSAGNSGPGEQTIGSPAVAKNVIATGACQNDRFDLALYAEGAETMADFSSRGPAEDGRIKPDITAPGTWIASLKSQFASDANAWLGIDENYLFQGGTSQSGPHVSGACAVFVQWYRETQGGLTPSPALVKASLINSAVDMTSAEVPVDTDDDEAGTMLVVGGTPPVPNNDEGWGRCDVAALITGERRFNFTDQGLGLKTGAVSEKRLIVGADDALKVTLAYTDVPGLPAAIPALVNDLDLEVISPDGRVFRGNAFLDGESVADTAEGDRINNVEGVWISNPAAGEWVLRVRAQRVLQDVHGRTNGAPEQDFALVASGQIPFPGEGVVSWNQETYPAPSVAQIRLVDIDLRNQASATVTVASDSQPAPLTLTLLRSGSGGTFTGSVSLATSPKADSLMVANGNTLTLSYTDASPAGLRTRTATIDLDPPVLDSVRAIQRFGRTSLRFNASEPVKSVAVINPINGPAFTVTNAYFRTSPELFLPELVPDQIYRYFIVATDGAGNVQTNDNAGRYYFFTATRPAKALLLYSPETTFEQLNLPFPGLEHWTQPLDALGIDYEVWNFAETNTVPSAALLSGYRVVIWRPEDLATLPAGLASGLSTYVASGGALFVASSEVLSRLSPAEQSFRTNVLHVADFTEDVGATLANGINGDPISAGLAIGLDYQEFPDLGSLLDFSTFPDALRPTADAASILTQDEGRIIGLRYPRTGNDSPGRVVFISIPWESIPTEAEAPDNKVTVLGRALDFLVPGLRGGSTVTFHQPAYTLPSAAMIEVNDAARSGQKRITLQLSSTSDPTGFELPLTETPLKGVFRGRVTLGTTATDANSTLLRCADGDFLLAAYINDSGVALSAQVIIDTVPPIISAVAHDPAYNEATIFWTTDKPTDTRVRFGESGGDDSLLTRTAYSADLTTEHEIQISGLQPDRDYYFLPVSQDEAGNAVTARLAGRSFRLRTLRPLDAPWADSLEKGRSGWATFDDSAFDDETGENLLNTTWQFGTPSNRYAITPHSGSNCWATNLEGQPVDTAIADLLSPAIDLRRGNTARLKFRTWYDTTERSDLLDFELCQVAISTNNGAQWSSLVGFGFGDVSDDWEEVDVDISRFTGHVVRIRFNYQLLSFETTDRPGWFVDDLEISLTQNQASSFSITNNLAQATFSIRGPTNFTAIVGSGRWFNVSNAVPGEYVVRWSPVDFYLTPPSVTNRVGTNALVVNGRYEFPDSNDNKISDLWENSFFGKILSGTEAEPGVDADEDGFSNFAEFQAGTDPKDPASGLRLNLPSGGVNAPIRVSWPSEAGREYQLEISDDLQRWNNASDARIGTGGVLTNTIPALLGQGRFYFRVRVQP
jgi:hypothetical protein